MTKGVTYTKIKLFCELKTTLKYKQTVQTTSTYLHCLDSTFW